MRHFRRSRLSILGVPALIIVSLYVLFELLDVDGSNFQNGGGAYTYEEKIAGEESVCGKGTSPAGPSPSRFLPPSTHVSPAGPTPAFNSRRLPCRIVRWRRMTPFEPVSRTERGEPPTRPA